MRNTKVGLGMVMFMLFGCGQVIDNPYESCYAGDSCSNGTTCTQANLAASSFVGNFCTTTCATSADCVVDLSNYSPVCVITSGNVGLCYIQCPAGGSTCPYGTTCVSVPGNPVQVCVP